MKGITCCAECAYYRMKTHKCSRGENKEPNLQNGDDVRFFADCPMDDFSPKKGKWLETNSELMPTHKPDAHPDSVFFATCSLCGITYNQLGVKHGWRYCPGCGYPMQGIYTENAKDYTRQLQQDYDRIQVQMHPERYGFKEESDETHT